MTLLEFDFSKLRGRIIERYGTCADFAKAMGKGATWLSDRLLSKTPWDLEEIAQVCQPEFLDIPNEKIHVYFFTLKVR